MRQYIGARYMPKFMGAYDPTTAYEALSVVDNGMGTSYVANQPVPAGTSLSDTTYWAVYGASNGAIINLQDQIDALNAIKTNKPRKLLVIGNSYVFFGVTDILESTFDGHYENTESATGFLPYTDTSKNFPDQLTTVINDPDIPKDEITDILFVSAMGDTRAYTENPSSWQSNVNTALVSIMTNITANFPNCDRVSLTLAETRDQPYFSNNTYKALFAVHKAFKTLCFNRGIDYIGWSGFNALFNSDYVENDHYHPSPAGHQVIGEWIKNAYYGSAEYKNLFSRKNVSCNYISGGTVMLHVEILPELVNIRVGNLSGTEGDPITITSASPLLTTADSDIPAPGFSGGQFNTPAFVTKVSSGTSDNVLFIGMESDSNGILYFYNYFNPQNNSLSGATVSFGGITNISYIP